MKKWRKVKLVFETIRIDFHPKGLRCGFLFLALLSSCHRKTPVAFYSHAFFAPSALRFPHISES